MRCSQADKLKQDRVGNIIMPIRDTDNKLHGYQIIKSDGEKKFIFGTQKKGNFYLLIADGLKISDCHYLFVGEGLATMVSWYLAMNEYLADYHYACVVALDADNIESVLINIWNKYPDIAVTLIADDDSGNPIENKGLDTCNKIVSKYQHKHKLDIFIPYLSDGSVA